MDIRIGAPNFAVILLGVLACYSRNITADNNNISDGKVYSLMKRFLTQNLSSSCRSAIQKVPAYLSAYDTIQPQRQFYYDSFGVGKFKELISDSQFQRNLLKCFKVAAEKEYSQSEYPFDYCYGYNSRDVNSQVYTICIPSPCEADGLLLLQISIKSLSPNYSNLTQIDKSICVRSRRENEWYLNLLPTASFGFILMLSIIVSLATIYHCQRGDKTKSLSIEIFLAFSAKKNFVPLCKMPKDRQSTITCMFGIRFLAILWLITGHFFALIEPYLDNPIEYRRDITGNFFNQWISNFFLGVDAFFVLAGTVNAYGFFRKAQRAGKKPNWISLNYWLKFYRHRVVRLWPAYVYTLLGVIFLSSSHYHAMWPELDPLVQCRQHWWENLLFINSLSENRCLGFTWYIGTEFIFYLLSPIFLLTLLRWKNFGLALCESTILISTSLRAFAMITHNLPPTQLIWNTEHLFNSNYMEQFLLIFIRPQYRIGPYIVGIVLGYYLVQLRNTRIEYGRKFIAIGWIFPTTAGLIAVYGLYPALQAWNWPIYYIIYGALQNTLFALAIASIIFICHCGYGGFINRFLSFSVFIPLSALGYSVYLTQHSVIIAAFLQLPFPYKYVGKTPFLIYCVVCSIFSYILGLQCSMLSELPAINIERILSARKGHERLESSSRNEHYHAA